MKVLFLLFSLALVAAKECSQTRTPEGQLPSCVRQKIDSIRSQPRWNPPAEVHAYSYKGKTVYLFSSPCCDQYNVLYDDACNYLCAPSGGLTGQGDERCTDFSDSAKHVRLVWKDNR